MRANHTGPHWIGTLAALVLGGCASVPMPDLGGIYSRSASHHTPETNPVIVIPGILGSRLEDSASGRIVWGAFGGGSANPGRADGARLVALPMGDTRFADLRDEVKATGALDSVRLRVLGLPVNLSAYAALLGTLGAGGYLDASFRKVDYGSVHFTCFQFAYDWRRDNIENARRLYDFIEEKRRAVEAENLRRFGRSGAPVKFDIVAHSMGGLLTRYMLMYGKAEPGPNGELPALTWAGARNVNKVLLIGTPNGGSVETLKELIGGYRPASILPRYSAAVLGTMPSIYQLLPDPEIQTVVDEKTGQRIDYLDPSEWERRGWGLASASSAPVLAELIPDEPDPARRAAIATAHLRKGLARGRAFRAALKRPHQLPSGLYLHLYAGDGVPTVSAMSIARDGALRDNTYAPGDGVVLRSSALFDTRRADQQQLTIRSPIPWTSVTFLQQNHLGLTKDPTFADNMLYQLLLAPKRGSNLS